MDSTWPASDTLGPHRTFTFFALNSLPLAHGPRRSLLSRTAAASLFTFLLLGISSVLLHLLIGLSPWNSPAAAGSGLPGCWGQRGERRGAGPLQARFWNDGSRELWGRGEGSPWAQNSGWGSCLHTGLSGSNCVRDGVETRAAGRCGWAVKGQGCGVGTAVGSSLQDAGQVPGLPLTGHEEIVV